MRIHIDTDFAGDPDDACAVAMLLGWPDVEITAITTTLEDRGRRAACLATFLQLAGHDDIPIAAGADVTLTGNRYGCTWGDARHWPTRPGERPSPPRAALDLLASSIEAGATILAIGGFTNLAMLERARPGTLRNAEVVALAGWVDSPSSDWPQWGPAMDFNTQCDTVAAELVAASTDNLTLVPLPVAMRATLTASDLEELRSAGPVGTLLADQSLAHAKDAAMRDLAAPYAALPDDLVNFHWDPVAAAVAAGWPGVRIETTSITTRTIEGALAFQRDPAGRPIRLATDLDAPAFRDRWLDAIRSLPR